MSAQELPTKMYPNGTKTWSESVKTSLLSLLETKLMLKTEKLKLSRSLSTERRIFNTMISQQRATINLRNHSSGSLEDSLGNSLRLFYINYRDPNLVLVEAPVLQPSEVVIEHD